MCVQKAVWCCLCATPNGLNLGRGGVESPNGFLHVVRVLFLDWVPFQVLRNQGFMSQFALVTSEGRFPVPAGESRVGSDSSCAVCVHGEGVLPVHAYLKVDGEKVLIRPFSEKAAIMIESAPVTGPQQVRQGQRVSMGPVQMRLVSDQGRWRFPWRLCVYALGSVAAVLLVLVMLRFLWFNESWWQAQILASVEQAVGRENVEIGELELFALDGRIVVRNLTIANRDPFPEDSHLLEVPEMELSVDLWPFLSSRFREVRRGRLTLSRPLLRVERIERDGGALSNMEDVLAQLGRRISEGLRSLAALEAEVTVNDGRVEFRDRLAGIESALSGIALRIAQGDFVQKLSVELQARPETGVPGAGQAAPRLGLSGDVRLFDAMGRIAPETIGDGRFTLALKSFDLARLCQHLRWEWRVRGSEQKKIVPGKPVTGELRISFAKLDRCEVTGSVESESLVSLLEPDRPPLGHIPTVVSVDRFSYDFEKGWPTDMEINLRADHTLDAARSHAEAKALVLRASLRRNAVGGEAFEIDLRSRLQDLCATDVGERLQLKGRIEGGLKASVSFEREAKSQTAGEGHGPQTRIRAMIELDRSARVLVPSPLPVAPPVWQQLRLTANLDATAGSTPKGDITDVKGRLKATSDAFSIESTEDTELTSLDQLDQFSLKTFLKVNLRGREFWSQYGPVLDLFGFDRPVEEEMNLSFMALSTIVPSGARAGTRQVKVGLDGKIARQWASDPAPVPVYFILDYYPQVYAASLQRLPGNHTPADPHLVLRLQTGTEQQQPYARLNVEVTRETDREIVRVPSLTIRSNMEAFEGRFSPYLKWAGDFLGTDVLERYRISGELGADGDLTVTRPLKRFSVGQQPFDAQFRITANGRNLAASGHVFAPPAKPDEKPRWWRWLEPSPELSIEGLYRYCPAPSREEPDVRRFDALNVKVRGQVGTFSFAATDLDLDLLDRLATRIRVPGKSWPDAAESLQIAGTVKPAAFDFLRRLELPGLNAWLIDPVVSGSLELSASFNRREDKAHLTKLVFQQEAGVDNAFWLKELNLVARLRGVRKLAREIFGRAQGTPLEAVRLLDHMSEGLVIHQLVFDAPSYAHWLASHPEDARENSFADFVPTALRRMLRSRAVDPQGPWVLTSVGLEGIAQQDQSWRVYGHFLTDALIALPAAHSLTRGAPAPALRLKGPWTLPEKDTACLTLSPDGEYLYLAMRADLDAADLGIRHLYPAWVYRKEAGQPLCLRVDGLFPLSSKGGSRVYSFKTLALEGGPLELRLEEGQARISTNRDGGRIFETLRLKDGTIKGGAVFEDVRLEDFSYSNADGQVIGRLTVRRIDVPTLARALPRFPGWSYEGLVNELALDVRGSLASLLALAPDVRQDRVRVDLKCDQLRITADTDRGEFTRMELNGQLGVSLARIDGRDLKVTLLHVRPGAGNTPAALSKHVVRIPELLMATVQPEQSLQGAFAKPPYPLQLNLPLHFETAVDVDRLAEAWRTVRLVHFKGSLPKEEAADTHPFETLRAIRADGALQTPSLKMRSWTLDGLNVPRYSLRDLKLTVPLCAVKYADGDLLLTTAFYDLNHPQIAHSQKFELTKAPLQALLGLAADDYRASGHFTVEGELRGVGVTPGPSWEGAADVHLREVTVDPPSAFARVTAPPADAPFADRLPVLARTVWTRIGGPQQLGGGEILQDLPGTGAAHWNALLTAASVMLGGYGYTSERLEFEPSRLQFVISHGIADLRPSRLVGRGASLGLELSASGRVRLSDGLIDGALSLHPLQLPVEARRTLRLGEWPRAQREQFQEDMTNGERALRVSGTWTEPRFAWPLNELRQCVRNAMPPPPPPAPQPPVGKDAVKPQPIPEEDPALTPEQALLAIFDRLAKEP